LKMSLKGGETVPIKNHREAHQREERENPEGTE
jgi:hypothetical protein